MTTSSTPEQEHVAPAAEFLRTYQGEHARTLRVLRAFPEEHADFAPHPTSSTARRLAWTFVLEGMGMEALLRDRFALSGEFPPPPESWRQIVEMFEEQARSIASAVEEVADSGLGGTARFFTGPGQMGDVARGDLLRFWLFDQIHHRGQLSVYLRMVGGKVPAIYGPSADEPWT